MKDTLERAGDSKTGTTEKLKQAWSKPTIRVMSVSFTQNSLYPRMQDEEPGEQYTPSS